MSEVPIVLHKGLTEEDIVRLAYEDNENDEYHDPLPVLNVWSDYAKLYEMWGNQQKVAEAVGVSQTTVSFRLRLNSLPDSIKKFISQRVLKEEHLKEIVEILAPNNISSWLTTKQAQLEIAPCPNPPLYDNLKETLVVCVLFPPL